jgi:parallel beta-helix repeat protein
LQGSYIDISNLEVKRSSGICVNSSGNYLKISGLVVHECQTHGILINGQHVEAVGNTVYATSFSNQARTNTTPGSWGSAIKIGLGGNDILISGNRAYHNYGEGIAATRGSNVMIRGNRVYDNFSVNIYVDNSFNIQAELNFVTCHANTGFERNGSPAAGIALGEEYYEGWGAQLNHVTITNNIVAFCSRGVYYFGGDSSLTGTGLKNSTVAYNTLWGSTNTALGIIYGNAQAGSLITSNIIWQADNKLAYVENSAGLTLKNNLWKTTPPANVRGTADRIGDPLFMVAPGYDPQTYQLSALSPAIGGALNIGVSTDYFGSLRGPSYEIGAVQYLNTIPSPIPTMTMNTSTSTAVWTPTQTTMATSTIVPTLIATSTMTSTSVPLTPTSTSIQSTPTSVVPAAAPSETVYNDNHAAFVYSGNWQNVSREKAYGGSFKVTRKIGSSVTLRFTGQSFSLLYTSGLTNGKFDVYVDNQLIATLDQKTSETLFQKRWDYAGRVPVGLHELRLVFTGPSDVRGTIDAVIVR